MISYEDDKTHGHRDWSRAIWVAVRAEETATRTPDADIDSLSLEELDALTMPETDVKHIPLMVPR